MRKWFLGWKNCLKTLTNYFGSCLHLIAYDLYKNYIILKTLHRAKTKLQDLLFDTGTCAHWPFFPETDIQSHQLLLKPLPCLVYLPTWRDIKWLYSKYIIRHPPQNILTMLSLKKFKPIDYRTNHFKRVL